MKLLLLPLCVLFTAVQMALSQGNINRKLSVTQLRQDLAVLQHLINDVHVYPYTELTPQQYSQLFKQIDAQLPDSATATAFLSRIKPLMAYLSDEHAQINLPVEALSDEKRNQPVYLPFSLRKTTKGYEVNHVIDSAGFDLPAGSTIAAINHIPVDTWLKRCALTLTGYPQQRYQKALREFGYLVPWADSAVHTSYHIKTSAGKSFTVKGTALTKWTAYLNRQNAANCENRISYTRYGRTGYINACSFDVKAKGPYSLDSIKRKIDEVFKQVKSDNIQHLVIDVSQNTGGNSAVGDYLISYINNKPYQGYQCDFKRSDDYLKLLESWGFQNPEYKAAPVGKVLHYPSPTVMPQPVPYPFNGKVTIAMGPATFSSAMNFVTLIRDNHIAPIIGQPSADGHPTGFGEIYYTNLPNSKIFVRLGVKQWIRPAGKIGENVLMPDKTLTTAQLNDVAMLLNAVK
jgi:hypothetical protein